MSGQHESNPQSDQAFYDRIAHAYDFIADANEHTARERGEAALNLQPGERVLEIGFGTGNSLIDLAKAVGDTGSVAGVDVSPKMRDVAAGKVAEAQLGTQVELLVGDARKLPFPDDSFQAAFTSFTLELFEPDDIAKVLAEVKRVLEPGGRLGVVSMAVVPAGEQESTLERTYKWMHQHFPHIVDCHPIDVDTVLKEAGYSVAHSDRMDIWTMPVGIVVGTA